jgi:hypothetical protein
LVHKTQDENKQSRKSTLQKIKKMSNTNPLNNREWTQVLEKGKQILLLIKHPSCILGNLFNRVSRTPHVKDLFCRLHKTVTATKDYFWSLPFSPCFTSGSQVIVSIVLSFPYFYIVLIYCWTCYRPEYSRNTVYQMLCNNQLTLSNNQPINQRYAIINQSNNVMQ